MNEQQQSPQRLHQPLRLSKQLCQLAVAGAAARAAVVVLLVLLLLLGIWPLICISSLSGVIAAAPANEMAQHLDSHCTEAHPCSARQLVEGKRDLLVKLQ
jgi:hypothetical protein